MLDDLPPYRRAKLLWHYAHFGVGGVEQLVRDSVGIPCLPRPGEPRSAPTAVLGDDGRAHLISNGRMLCAETETERGWEHHEYCDWLEGESGPQDRGRGATPAGFRYESAQTVWFVRPTGQPMDPLAVLPTQRCHGARHRTLHHWAPTPAKTATVRRFRAALVEALGPYCHLCTVHPGSMVDHDHETGLVRGLLCALCNRSLEQCPHVSGCPKSDYMARPPAARLGLMYPSHLEWKPKESTRVEKIELLGFDPFENWGSSAWWL